MCRAADQRAEGLCLREREEWMSPRRLCGIVALIGLLDKVGQGTYEGKSNGSESCGTLMRRVWGGDEEGYTRRDELPATSLNQ
jgi:hypothetical protein